MIAELRCCQCNHLIGKNVVAGEFKCSKCGTFVIVVMPEFDRVSWFPRYNDGEVDSKGTHVL